MEKEKFEKEVKPFLKRMSSYIISSRTRREYEKIDKILDIKSKILDEAFSEGNEETSFNSIIEKYIPNYFKKTNVKKTKKEEK